MVELRLKTLGRMPRRPRYGPPRAGAVASVLACVLLSLWPASAPQAAAIEAVDIGTMAGNRIQIRFQLTAPAGEPRSFTVHDPARIVLDFPGVTSDLQARQRDIGSGVAQSVSVLEGPGRTRATINLTRVVPYGVATQGNVVMLTLEAGGIASAPSTRRAAPAATARAPAARGSVPRMVTKVDFRRGPQGQGIVVMTLSDPDISASVREQGDKIVADFARATLPRGQERRLDVTDFATPVSMVDAVNRGESARISIQPTGRYDYIAYQSDDRFTIEVKPAVEEEEDEEEFDSFAERRYVGEVLSLNFQDIEVRAVLQIISDFTGLNVVVSDSVQGNLTLRLKNVPWDQALDIILRTKGLTMRQNGNVIYIAPTEEVAAREKLELEARKQVEELAPLRSELIQVNYAKAADLGSLIRSGEVSMLSERGNVSVDERTNTLLVQDVADKLTEIRNLVNRLDVPVRQVMIDSRIVIANEDFSKQLGVQFGGTAVTSNDGGRGVVGVAGSATGTDTITSSALTNLAETGSPFPVTAPSLSDRLGVRLGTPNDPFGRVALAILGRDYLLDLELSALQAEGQGEVLSNPRVITTDRQEAFIKQGREIPFEVVSDDGVSISFKEAKLELIVVPQITPDNRIIMDLTVNKNEQGPDVATSTGGSVPSIDTREVRTQVLVDNGETVVLGGVFEQIVVRNRDKVPLLGDIPGLGRLFRRDTTQNDRDELLIFVTPKIVHEGGASL